MRCSVRILLVLSLAVIGIGAPRVTHATAYASTIAGTVAGYRLAGVEPDGDPLYQVVLKTKLASAAGTPAVNLIVSSYLENFRPDTTPILPDLLHPTQTAHNLGGFLQGKVLLTDDAGNVLYIGSFLAEAFLNNTNHAVMQLFGSGTSYGGSGRLKGTFSLDRSGHLTGRFQGSLKLSAGARRQIARNAGAHLKPLQKIISVVTVTPHYYGTHGVKGSGQPLHTGYGTSGSTSPAAGSAGAGRTQSSGGVHISTWTVVAGSGAVISLLLAAVLYIWERRREGARRASAS